jgi:soluble lytic murein transglycosylase-like protein
MGPMQLMPDVAEAFGVEHPFDPRENIMAGARLLRELLDHCRGDLRLVIAGYVKKVKGLIGDARHAGNDDE